MAGAYNSSSKELYISNAKFHKQSLNYEYFDILVINLKKKILFWSLKMKKVLKSSDQSDRRTILKLSDQSERQFCT